MEAEERIVKVERYNGHLKSVMAEAKPDEEGVLHLPHEIEAGPVEYKRTLVYADQNRMVHLTTQMKWRLREGSGEALYELGIDDDGTAFGLSQQDMQKSIDNLCKMAKSNNAEVALFCEREGKQGKVCEMLVRELREDQYTDIRFAVCGNIGAGKSTLIGVLCFGDLDNGEGETRNHCLTHLHEVMSGQTSSITQEILGFDREGNCINYSPLQDMSWGDIIEKSFRVVSFFDMAGNERYLKTTLFGMSGQMPDYSFLVISAEKGVDEEKSTTKEHYELSVALKIPVVMVITHIDAVTAEELEEMVESSIYKLNIQNTMTVTDDNLEECYEMMDEQTGFVPIFFISCVTGQNLELIKKFLNSVPPRRMWDQHAPAEVVIDKVFDVTGVGTIVAGTVVAGTVELSTLLLGPQDEEGTFNPVTITSIHKKRVPVNTIACGHDGAFALADIPRTSIRKGMVLVHPDVNPKAVWTFEANVVSATVRQGIEPVVHTRNIRQSARIWHVSPTNLCSSRGAKSNLVCFKFKYQPEYLAPGMRIIFREAGCKGIGTITRINVTRKDYPFVAGEDFLTIGDERGKRKDSRERRRRSRGSSCTSLGSPYL